MITMHSVSAAYVLARQAEERQEAIDHRTPYEPACELSWATSVAAVDETADIQDKEQAA